MLQMHVCVCAYIYVSPSSGLEYYTAIKNDTIHTQNDIPTRQNVQVMIITYKNAPHTHREKILCIGKRKLAANIKVLTGTVLN